MSHAITNMCSLKDDTNKHLQNRDRLTERTDLWLPRGRGLGEEQSGRLGLANEDYYTQGGYTKRSYCIRPWDSPGKNAGVGCHSLFQGIFPSQGLNLGLLHCRQILYHLSHQGGRCIAQGTILNIL